MSDSSTDAAAVQADATDVNPAGSSVAETQGAEPSVYDAVKAALEAPAKEASPDSDEGQAAEAEPTSEAEAPAEAEEDLTNPTDDDLKKLGPKTQRRIKALLDQRSGMRSELEALAPKAKAYDEMQQFAARHNLKPADIDATLEIAALIQSDPHQAINKVAEVYRHLALITGDILPPDVQEQVNLGYLTTDHAKELVRNRNEAARLKAEREAREQQIAKEREYDQVRSSIETAQSTGNEWELSQKQRDPDWNAKRPLVDKLLRLHVRENGFPPTKAAVVETLDAILAEVNKNTAAFRPKPTAVTPVTGVASSGARAEPKDPYEAARIALGLR